VNLVSGIIKGAKWLAQSMREKEPVRVDEFVLEHMLLYHGLVGSTPENQRQIRDVRADISQAVKDGSRVQLAISLKLPPLEWVDKLTKIVLDLNREEQRTLCNLLMPDNRDGSLTSNENPLTHEDWRVRANAAHLLAVLQEKEAVPRLGELLQDTTDGGKLSFYHVAQALAELRTDEGLDLLLKQTNVEEDWLRVDLAGAVSQFPFDKVARPLAEMLTNEMNMKDYMAVAVAKNIPPEKWLQDNNDSTIRNGGLSLVSGLVDAAQGSFTPDIAIDSGVLTVLNEVLEIALTEESPIAVQAALSLVDWCLKIRTAKAPTDYAWLAAFQPNEAVPAESEMRSMEGQLKTEHVKKAMMRQLESLFEKETGSSPGPNPQLRAAIQVCGVLPIPEAHDVLLPWLKKDFLYRDTVIETLTVIAQPSAAAPLMALVREIVRIDERGQMPKSKQPVLEEDPIAAKTYWLILKSLGKVATPESAEFLLAALQDYAPDKRAEALSSLISLSEAKKELHFSRPIAELLDEGLHDNAPLVKLAALDGVVKLDTGSAVNSVVALINYNENAVSKHAFAALDSLKRGGHDKVVREALELKLRSERDSFKRKRLEDFLGR
jgi:HEAT repeat protein